MTDPLTFSTSNMDLDSLRQSDILMIGASSTLVWVDDARLIAGDADGESLGALPDNPFPFARLASISIGDFTYLYHQINETTFAEEQYDSTLGRWLEPAYITV